MKKLSFTPVLIALAFTLAACFSGTELNAVWKDNAYRGRLDKVLIIGMAKDSVIRQMFEDRFAEHMRSHGINAVESHRIIPLEKLNRETVVSKAKELNISHVLVTKLVDKEEYSTYVPPGKYSESFIRFDDAMSTPGYYASDVIYSLETTIYSKETKKPVWAALSKTLILGDLSTTEGVIDSFVKVMMKKLSKDRFLRGY